LEGHGKDKHKHKHKHHKVKKPKVKVHKDKVSRTLVIFLHCTQCSYGTWSTVLSKYTHTHIHNIRTDSTGWSRCTHGITHSVHW